jgi:hypothetical protein
LSSFETWARFESSDATGALSLIRTEWGHMRKGQRARLRPFRSTCWGCGRCHPVTKHGSLNRSPVT